MHSVTETTFARPPGEEMNQDDEPRKSCQIMEDVVYGQLTHIFNTLFRTHKGDQGGFNPFIAGHTADSEASFDESSKTMIQEIREKIFGSGTRLQVLNHSVLTRIGYSLLVEHNRPLQTSLSPGIFGKDNAGRLAARFLASFVPLPGKMRLQNTYETFTTIS